MPEPISIISDQVISLEEFKDFLRELKITVDPDPIYHGRLSDGESQVWIVLDNEELKNFEEEEIKVMSERLGDKPRSHILLDVGKFHDSELLVQDFIVKMGQRWHCVVYDLMKDQGLFGDVLMSY